MRDNPAGLSYLPAGLHGATKRQEPMQYNALLWTAERKALSVFLIHDANCPDLKRLRANNRTYDPFIESRIVHYFT